MSHARRRLMPPLPPLASLARGLAHQVRLDIAARFGGWSVVQRRLAMQSTAATLHWREPPGDPVAELHAAESSWWSQNGEDGLLRALLDRIGAPTRTFAEIGASDGEENCTRALAEEGWRGFWFEADPERAERARRATATLDVDVHCAAVSSDNVVSLMTDAGVPGDADVVVLDIDSNDFWVLRAMLRDFSPRVLVVEYNSTFPPGVFWTRRKRRHTNWDETFRHGASLEALAWLTTRAGYQVVACDSSGVNAFFVRRDVASAARLGEHRIEELYRPLVMAAPAIGHPWRREPPCPRLTDDELGRIRVSHGAVVGTRLLDTNGSARLVGVRARVKNGTNHRLSSTGPTPMRLSAHLVAHDGTVVEYDGDRNWIHGGVPAHGQAWTCGIFLVDDARVQTVRLCLVQDGVAWLDHGAFDVALP